MKYIPWEIHEKIYKHFKNGGQKLTPLWHLDKKDIDFERTDTTLIQLKNGYSIVEVDAAALMNKMGPPYVKLYSGKLYHDNSERKISQVLYHWMNGEKLIPPVIIIHDETISSIVSNAVAPQDGNHRLRAAYHFGVKKIPIIVLDAQLSKFIKMMEM